MNRFSFRLNVYHLMLPIITSFLEYQTFIKYIKLDLHKKKVLKRF